MLSQTYQFANDSNPLIAKHFDQEDDRNLKISCQKIEEAQSPSTDYSDAPEESNDLGIQLKKSLSKSSSAEGEALYQSELDADEACEDDGEVDQANWNEKKDKILKNLAAKCKYDWKKIAKKFNGGEKSAITPLELKNRYKELTKVSIPLRVKFSHEEDLRIAKYFDIFGCDWAQIAIHFADRTAIMLKNRYYSHIRKKNLLNSMLDELRQNGDEIPTNAETEESTEENNEDNTEENDAEESTAEETTEEEVNVENDVTEEFVETNDNTEVKVEKIEEEVDDESIFFFTENQLGITSRRISIRPIVYSEIENCLTSVLFDKITFSRF